MSRAKFELEKFDGSNDFGIMMDLAIVEVKIVDEDQALLLLCFVLEAYESFVDTVLYGRTSITLEGGVVRISKGALVVMKELLQKRLYVLQGMASTIAFECPTLKVNYLESFRDGGDLVENDKVEKHSLHTCGEASKFLINNVTFDVPILVKQIDGTCRGQVERLGRKVEFWAESSARSAWHGDYSG
ncbi:hypothetical protein CRG98_040682 [Punica granatum]|uniref:Uncharacterized protein n=1 Tax=Punica granatum TaxID=22663 RepID=A0A2I0I5G3_PUNGR|nr:hypothetical protein CRG98_040682 [Punica granatum]